MPSPGALVPPDAIRIEDEVWQEAFSRREAARSRTPRDALAGTADSDGLRGPSAPRPSVAARPAAAPPRAAGTRRPAPTATRPAPAPRASGAPVRGATSANGRRTITITGRGAERHLPWPGDPGRRPARRAHERSGFRPDRVAMWAVFLGILLVAVAMASPHS